MGAVRSVRLDRWTVAFAALAGAFVVAGGGVAAVNSATPFAHGSWLAAYLVLVGGAAQLGLAAGRLMPVRSGAGPASVELALWNFGSLCVPAGVLTGAPPVVTLGSVALLIALARFARSARGRVPGWSAAYLTFVAALAVSVIVGNVLAYAGPPAGS